MPLLALYDLPAPAKLNLFLHVVGRRADGYHLLQSVFVLIDWCDHLHFELRHDGQLARHDLSTPLPADDLCLRAARLLQQVSNCTLGADISIAKQIPSGAGMGGGSSDAATVLLALNRLWGLNWTRLRLATLGLQLGADVPFFVQGHNAFVEGVGDLIRPMRIPISDFAVVKPPASLPTREIFEHPLLKRDHEAATLAGSFDATGVADWPADWGTGFGNNDLQPAAQDRCPEVAQAARWLEARYGNSRMTGSGSAVFARTGFDNGKPVPPLTASTASMTIAMDELPPDWTGRICHSLQQHPLRGWAAD